MTLEQAWMFGKMWSVSDTLCHCMKGVTLVVTWIHRKHICLATSVELCVALHLQQVHSRLHLHWALHQLAVCKRAHMSTYPVATVLDRELIDPKLVATMMLKVAKPADLNIKLTVTARKAYVPENAPVPMPVWSVSSHVSKLWISTNVQGFSSHSKTVACTTHSKLLLHCKLLSVIRQFVVCKLFQVIFSYFCCY